MAGTDVVVAGAGPAGAVAAALLARTGLRVALVDRVADERHKIGECLPEAGAQLLRRLRLPAPVDGGLHERIDGVHSLWAGEEVIHDAFNDPGGGGWRLDRRAFERDLRRAAVDEGAATFEDRIVGIERDGGGWCLETTSGRSVAASTVIDATGRRAWIARRLGARQLPDAPLVAVWALGRRAAGGHATRTYIETEADGWWYGAVLPCGAPLAAFHCPPKLATWLAREPGRWRARLAESRLLANVLEAGSFRDAHPFRADARGLTLEPVCGPGWFAVGDAALSFDPVASQGLFNSVASAAMAARAATSGDPHAARARYVERLSEVRAVYRDRLRELAIRRASTGAVVSW